MLTIIVPGVEYFDDESQTFSTFEDATLELEHSLVALSKWESKHEVPFLNKDEKSTEQIIDYIKCMVLTPDVPEEVFQNLSNDNFSTINTYIESKMTATWFTETPGASRNREIITSELIYYWMIALDISFECQYWHLNKLLTLIRVCNVKQSKPEQMSQSEILSRNRELNEQRKKELGTSG